ncbi:MAG: carboxylating nicotinate-nucleotide diphosphorylase [Clostridia bacterium]|nr:carboxylating nicotinate-nucleotide diphosphorylase [Clostridia bacterium]
MLDMTLVDDIVIRALKEDMPMGDLTTDSTVPADEVCSAKLIAKEEGVMAGLDVFERVFTLLDPKIYIEHYVADGDLVKPGTQIMHISGNARAMLKAERTALNLLQRMCGIATMTRKFADKLQGTKSKIVDTRKTAPGLRYLDKYAVRAGGGTNHRFCLSDGVLIKDNHIKAAGGITEAVKRARAIAPHTIRIEVETESMEQVKEALEAGADIIMLDNMKPEAMKEAVQFINGKALTEASGNITVEKAEIIAQTGVDLISSGSLTHSVKAMDISLRFE